MDKGQDSTFVKLIPFFEKYGILLLILIMVTVLHILQPDVFLSWRNITNVFKQVSWQSMLALGVFMVIVTAGLEKYNKCFQASIMAIHVSPRRFYGNCNSRYRFIGWFNNYAFVNGFSDRIKSRHALVCCNVGCPCCRIFMRPF